MYHTFTSDRGRTISVWVATPLCGGCGQLVRDLDAPGVWVSRINGDSANGYEPFHSPACLEG